MMTEIVRTARASILRPRPDDSRSLPLLLRPARASRADAGVAVPARAGARQCVDVPPDVRARIEGSVDGGVARSIAERRNRLAHAALPQTSAAAGPVFRHLGRGMVCGEDRAAPAYRSLACAQSCRRRDWCTHEKVHRCAAAI